MSVTRIATVMASVVAVLLGGGVVFGAFIEMDFHVSTRGSVTPGRVMPVRVQGPGRVVSVAPSGPVKEDEVLIEMSSSSSREALALVDEQLALLRTELEKESSELGNPQRRFSLGQSLKSLERERARLAREVRNAIIRAPFAGTIVEINVEEGEYLGAGQTVAMTLADEQQLRFMCQLSPEERPELVEGQKVLIRMDGYSHLTYGPVEGLIERIEGVLEEDSVSSYRLHVSVTPPRGVRLFAGMNGVADIVTFHGTALSYFTRESRQ